MNRVFVAILLALGAWGIAQAHGDFKPKHGGVVQVANDLGFELVTGADEVSIYIDDHGKAMNPAGMSGKLTILQGGVSTEVALAVSGDRMAAKAKIGKGAKVVASLKTVAGNALTVRFTVK